MNRIFRLSELLSMSLNYVGSDLVVVVNPICLSTRPVLLALPLATALKQARRSMRLALDTNFSGGGSGNTCSRLGQWVNEILVTSRRGLGSLKG